ncbi:MAG: hypothetical protein IPK65_00025 [Gammaproteobacteria bacterium]|nr:hypothetical protein [Gammaproteobacteria bacterium]
MIAVIPRLEVISIFRKIAESGFSHRETPDIKDWSLAHSALGKMPEIFIETIVKEVSKHPLGYAALRPLLILEGLPRRETWRKYIASELQDADLQTLAQGVLLTLDHQSQESTDVRWLTVIFKMALGLIYFGPEGRETVAELIEYPNRGDMRKVRPTIRSTELAFCSVSCEQATDWSRLFWSECLARTNCTPRPLDRTNKAVYDYRATFDKLVATDNALVDHWVSTVTTTGVDARHDGAFGLVSYGLALASEMLFARNDQGISGRLLLRALVEARINLAYLAKSDDHKLWNRYRAYGAGQAKLSLLKLDEASGVPPSFVGLETLETLSNEDFFQEFVDIELGHWCDSDLRRMSDDCGTKDHYDLYYGWTSAFAHSQWGAVRNSCMTHCFNPLHRLHRIPMPMQRTQNSVLPDAVLLVNAMFGDLSKLYPGLDAQLALVTKSSSEESGAAAAQQTKEQTDNGTT